MPVTTDDLFAVFLALLIPLIWIGIFVLKINDRINQIHRKTVKDTDKEEPKP